MDPVQVCDADVFHRHLVRKMMDWAGGAALRDLPQLLGSDWLLNSRAVFLAHPPTLSAFVCCANDVSVNGASDLLRCRSVQPSAVES
jgi:hypothetical protein